MKTTIAILTFAAVVAAYIAVNNYADKQRRQAVTDAITQTFNLGFIAGYERAVSNWQSPPLQPVEEQRAIDLTNFLSQPNTTNLINLIVN